MLSFIYHCFLMRENIASWVTLLFSDKWYRNGLLPWNAAVPTSSMSNVKLTKIPQNPLAHRKVKLQVIADSLKKSKQQLSMRNLFSMFWWKQRQESTIIARFGTQWLLTVPRPQNVRMIISLLKETTSNFAKKIDVLLNF